MSTVFLTGDVSQPRTADEGFDCRVDLLNGLWGFCPNSVIAATDCGLAGSCFDSSSCSDGCGFTNSRDLTTFTCVESQFCSTALLTLENDQSYTYIACGGGPNTDHYNARPTLILAPMTTLSSIPAVTAAASSSQEPTVVSSTASSSTSSDVSSSTLAATETQQSSLSSSSVPSGTSSSLPSTSTILEAAAASSMEPKGGGTNNTGAIVGGVVGCLALLCGFGIALVYLLRRGKARRSRSPKPDSSPKLAQDEFKEPSHANGGWAPRELPAQVHYVPPMHPVELPAYSR
ncbi:hypothetical protein NKR23_g363 [Pleurostoma richardsiae]|uniref:Uncharacterized protein n=1 Tax=Pleurostoma richardsiae TaxID=41990 RepID=A0AA38S6N2_9PEZI|nr:hypothetical protein NKR23_g363 [Pleurostoma richardsiae]